MIKSEKKTNNHGCNIHGFAWFGQVREEEEQDIKATRAVGESVVGMFVVEVVVPVAVVIRGLNRFFLGTKSPLSGIKTTLKDIKRTPPMPLRVTLRHVGRVAPYWTLSAAMNPIMNPSWRDIFRIDSILPLHNASSLPRFNMNR